MGFNRGWGEDVVKKADCTPEQWEAYKAYGRRYYRENREKALERQKTRNRTEEAKKRRREYDMRPDVAARRKDRQSDPAYQKARWEKIKSDPEKRRRQLDSVRKCRTGVDAETFQSLLKEQDSLCGICLRPFGDQKPRADHCHDSRKPRGLLCHHCNIIEGMVRSLGLTPHDFADRLHDYISNPPFSRVS